MALTDHLIEEAARCFALLSDPTRLRILSFLLERDEASVTEVAQGIGVNRTNVSQHLSRLLSAGMVARRRKGHSIHYRVIDEMLKPLCNLVCSNLEARTGGLVARLEERAR
jgi:ArsR family transcriptional regulator, lead/cadmium/zinc/bismuth-responsive transcriptional repressor